MKRLLCYTATILISIALVLWLIGAVFHSSFLFDAFMNLIFGFLGAIGPIVLMVLGIFLVVRSIFR